jgi:HEAT repeat protein
MSNKKFEQQLAALEQLRHGAASAPVVDDLRKALLNRNNYIVAKASEIAAQLRLDALIPDLLSALDRFFIDPVKTDPQCWAKNAIVKALAELGHDDAAAYLRGLRHVQMEPVWRGQEDTAGTLRGNCALALTQCRGLSDFELLSHLLEALFDHDKNVRIEAARAIGRVGRPEASLLLRLRALAGDEEPEVAGACFSALLSIEGDAGIGFLGRFLDNRGESGSEAALSLGLMRSPAALKVLKERWSRETDASFVVVLLSAIALTREPEALDFLLQLVETGTTSAASAVEALASVPLPAEMRSRLGAAVERSGDARLRSAYEKTFG